MEGAEYATGKKERLSVTQKRGCGELVQHSPLFLSEKESNPEKVKKCGSFINV